MNSAPVVVVIFNRPAETARTFAAIRQARPPILLVVGDGPRSDRAGDVDLCSRARQVVENVDWPCRVLRNFSDINLGCGWRVASGLDWAFEQVEEAIILEDDCLPDSTFFPYATELLERYRDDERIMMISGDNFQNGASCTKDSYYFSRIPHCWGWASWRRAWRLYDYEIHDWPRRREARWLKPIAGHPALEKHWTACFDAAAGGKVNTWDYQWMYCMFVHNGLSIAPNVNLVTNIGFGDKATHTFVFDERHVVASCAMDFPICHPGMVEPCDAADALEKRYLHRLPWIALYRIQAAMWSFLGPARPWLTRLGIWPYLRSLAGRFGR